jgi:hypothetical protein
MLGWRSEEGMHDDELTQYREEVRRLTAENRDLRRAAKFFGDLAERLNRQLRAERVARKEGPRFPAKRSANVPLAR